MPVDRIMPDFQSLTVVKSGGIMGSVERLHVDRTLRTTVSTLGAEHQFDLDACDAENLLHALADTARRQPGASERRGADLFQYDIELCWNGSVYRVRSVDLGADEALHGIMLVANRLLRQAQAQTLGLRAVPHDETAAAVEPPPPNGNPGIVPPWLGGSRPNQTTPAAPWSPEAAAARWIPRDDFVPLPGAREMPWMRWPPTDPNVSFPLSGTTPQR